MEEEIKKYKEKFYNTNKKFVRGSKKDFIDFINEFSINILKAQNKELEEKPITKPERESDVYDEGLKDMRDNIIEKNNEIINNL